MEVDSIHVTLDQVIKVQTFTVDSFQYHKKQGRSEHTTMKDIFIGKLGEFAFKNYYGDRVSDIKLDIIEDGNDGGWDFYFKDYPKYKIDVKTQEKKFHSKIWINPNNAQLSHYAAMYINKKLSDNSYLVGFKGFCMYREAVHTSSMGVGFNKKELYFTNTKYFKLS